MPRCRTRRRHVGSCSPCQPGDGPAASADAHGRPVVGRGWHRARAPTACCHGPGPASEPETGAVHGPHSSDAAWSSARLGCARAPRRQDAGAPFFGPPGWAAAGPRLRADGLAPRYCRGSRPRPPGPPRPLSSARVPTADPKSRPAATAQSGGNRSARVHTAPARPATARRSVPFHRIPLITRRWSAHCLPRRPLDGSNGAICAHARSVSSPRPTMLASAPSSPTPTDRHERSPASWARQAGTFAGLARPQPLPHFFMHSLTRR